MRVRGDGRRYTFNLKPESANPDDLYQGVLAPPAGKWVTIGMPISSLMLSRRGKPQVRRSLDGSVAMESVGFLLANDDEPGSFRLDVAGIRILPFGMKPGGAGRSGA
mmetsp:Transcript_386/g.1284  ORF Transcript_386/g.1284 Transcript_386/m.1284 type:complete len:107 (+) Transcript_386:205-525(+)